MIKIFKGEMTRAEREQLPSFLLGKDLFREVEAYVRENRVPDETCFSVVDQRGKILFCVVYLEDLIAGIKRKDLSDYDDRLRHNREELDFTLIDQYQKFVFLEVDAYSVAAARLILECRPEKTVVFGDRRARYFMAGKRVKYLRFPHDAGQYMQKTEDWMRGSGSSGLADRVRAFAGWKILGRLKEKGTCCVVKADRRNHPDEGECVYNSQNVMYSLLWKKNERSLGEKNADKKIIILDYPCDDEGLGSIAKCAFAHIMWMTKSGYIPVMNLAAYPNQYLNREGENMWEYFFEPVSAVSAADAYESRHVTLAVENDMSWCDFHINPYQRNYMKTFANAEKFRQTVRINRETKNHIEEKMPRELREGKRVLGIVARGTDFRKSAAIKTNKTWRQDVVEIDPFIKACEHYKEKHKYDYIFLATEDQEFFDKFQAYFGEELLSVSQNRVSYDYDNKEFKPVKELLASEDGKKLGRDYLSVVWSLTECKALLYNVECGAVRLAWWWKQDKYEIFQCIGSGWKGEVDE